MSLFGGSKSKSSTSQSQVGSQTQLGDPLAINISQGKKSRSTISIQQVDHGSVARAFNLADKTIDSQNFSFNRLLSSADKQAARSNSFALDTIAAAERVSSEIIEAGQYSAGATERIAGAFEAFVDEQNNPNEKNQMILIVAVLAGMALVIVKVKK